VRRRVEKLALLALFALLAYAMYEYVPLGAATAKPANNAAGPIPSFTDRGASKFDLLFREPELALP
jgi:hypothetical protein